LQIIPKSQLQQADVIRGVHKGHLQSGGGRFVQCGYFADKRGSSVVDVRTFWCKKHRIFRNLWCVLTDKGGWVSANREGGGSIFCDFVRTSFMDES